MLYAKLKTHLAASLRWGVQVDVAVSGLTASVAWNHRNPLARTTTANMSSRQYRPQFMKGTKGGRQSLRKDRVSGVLQKRLKLNKWHGLRVVLLNVAHVT